VAQRIEAGDVGAAGFGGQRGCGLSHVGISLNYRDAPARAFMVRTSPEICRRRAIASAV
jgi:hypothetical protein